MLVCNNNKFLLSPKLILFSLVCGRVKTQTAGVSPPSKISKDAHWAPLHIYNIQFAVGAAIGGPLGLMFHTTSTDFVFTKELLEEVCNLKD